MLSGACANCGNTRKLENIAMPTRKPVRFVNATAGLRSTAMSINGCATRVSIHTNRPISDEAAQDRADVRGRAPAPLTGLRDAEQDRGQAGADNTTAPSQSTFVFSTGGEGGTKRCTAYATGSAIMLTQNSQSRLTWSTISPESGNPMPPPIPNTALMIAMPLATWSRGNVSRMIPNASGNTPPATPCSTRPAISTSIVGASALITAPIEKMIMIAVSTRPLPYRSPSLPAIGVAIDALTRKPVSTQLTALGDASNSCASAGSAGTTSVCESAKAMPAPVSVRRTGVGRCCGGVTGRSLLTPRQRFEAIRRARSANVASTSSSMVRRKTASSAWAASGRDAWIDSSSSSQRSASA